MLNAAAMKDLLTANVDSHASHFAFFSRHGTLLGHDHTANVKATKRFTAFAANTWAHNQISIRENSGQTCDPLTPGTKIMRAVVKEDGSGLEWLVVRVGGLVGAVTHVREGTLVAALKGWGEFGGEGGGEGDEMRGVGVEGGEGGEGGEGSEGEDGARWKGRDDGERGKGRDEGEEKPSMMQILVWRSEGMGAYMAEELGEKFRIPKGFY